MENTAALSPKALPGLEDIGRRGQPARGQTHQLHTGQHSLSIESTVAFDFHKYRVICVAFHVACQGRGPERAPGPAAAAAAAQGSTALTGTSAERWAAGPGSAQCRLALGLISCSCCKGVFDAKYSGLCSELRALGPFGAACCGVGPDTRRHLPAQTSHLSLLFTLEAPRPLCPPSGGVLSAFSK